MRSGPEGVRSLGINIHGTPWRTAYLHATQLLGLKKGNDSFEDNVLEVCDNKVRIVRGPCQV